MSISVTNTIKLYDQQKALNQVSFEVEKGQIVGFLGPNGAGKSTMMKIITGFIPPTQGTVLVCGHNVTENPILVKQKVGYLPESNPLYYDMYVKEYLFFVGGLYQINNLPEKVDEVINLVGLNIEQHKLIGSLSKGYKQRVGLAQALIHNPEVLILDEPTSGLDPNQIVEIRNLIKSIGQQKTVLMSTHIMQEVEAICDRVIIINKGQIVADKTIDEIKKMITSKPALFVEFKNSISKELLLNIEGVSEVEHEAGNKWKLYSQKDIDIRESVFKFSVANHLDILSLQERETSLEDVFKSLTA